MKILYINSFYPPEIHGGAELTLQLLVESISNLGHTVVVVTTTKQKVLTQEFINGIKVIRIPLTNIYYPNIRKEKPLPLRMLWHIFDSFNPFMSNEFQKILKIEKPDIVSSHNLSMWSISIWSAVKRFNIPLLQVLHDFYLLCPNVKMFKDNSSCVQQCFTCKCLRINHKKKSNNIDAVVGISSFMIDKFKNYGYFENSKHYVVNNIRLIKNTNTSKRRDKITLGYIGTLTESKGIEMLLNSFKQIKDKSVTLIIAGKGDDIYVNKLKGIVEGDSRVSFLGFIQSDFFYDQIHCLVVPSLWNEPLGMVAVEGILREIPVLTTGKGGLSDIIINNKNGWIFLDEQDLTIKIRELIKDFDKLVNALDFSSNEHFSSVKRFSTQYEEIYKTIAHSK